MALCVNSLVTLPPSSHPRKLAETSCCCSRLRNGSLAGALKPIVVSGNPPTFVSAPGRRIVAGLFLLLDTFWGHQIFFISLILQVTGYSSLSRTNN